MSFRFRFLTHKKIQIRLASVFVLWFAVFAAFFFLIFVTNFATASDRTKALPLSDQLLAHMILVNQTQDLSLKYGLAMLGYCIFVWAYVLVYSHRMTGPVYKLTQILKAAAKKGELPDGVRFRKTDAFPDLEKAFNAFLESQRAKKN